jgi:hypothetical protein
LVTKKEYRRGIRLICSFDLFAGPDYQLDVANVRDLEKNYFDVILLTILAFLEYL